MMNVEKTEFTSVHMKDLHQW